MISVEKLHNYLSKNSQSDGSDFDSKNLVFKIPETKMSDGHIYSKYVMDGKFAFLGKELLPVPAWTELGSDYQLLVDKTAVKRNSFVIAILNQVMPEFRYFDAKSRITFAKDLMRQIAYDMEEKSLYRELEYTRQRNNIRTNFMNFEDIDNEEIMKKIIIDYFSLTVYIIKKNPLEKFGRQRLIEKISFIPGVWKKTERNEEYSIKNPSCFIIEQEDRYLSVVRKDLRGIFSWQEDGMEDLFTQFSNESEIKKPVKKAETKTEEVVVKVAKLEKSEAVKKKLKETIVESKEDASKEVESKEDVSKEDPLNLETTEKTDSFKIPKKITLTEIQALAEKEGISIVKKSDKTGKELKKSIQELREEIMKKYE